MPRYAVRFTFGVAVVGAGLVFGLGGRAAELTVRTLGGQIEWRVGQSVLGRGADWLRVRDLAGPAEFVPVPVTEAGPGFQGRAAGIGFAGRWQDESGRSGLRLTVTADPPRDRALTVRVSLPWAAVGGTWWDDLTRRRRIEPGKRYQSTTDWGGRWEISWYPCCAVASADGVTGVSLAVPLDEPRLCRFVYDAGAQTLDAEFDLGLSPDCAKSPARAEVHLIALPIDPAWGFRSATSAYYGLFPAYAERRARQAGIWLLGFNPSRMASPWDFGFAFDEGAQSRADYDCAHGILPFVYTEPWGKYEHFGDRPTPDRKPRYGETAPLLPAAELTRLIEADRDAPPERRDQHFGGAARREVAQANANSAIVNPDGTWVWRHWTDEWSHNDWLSNVTLNPDPDLPEPNRASLAWSAEIDPAFALARNGGGDLAGVYLDSVASFMGFANGNFRRDHWRVADIPLVGSVRDRAPCQLHAFACAEFARAVAERQWGQGKLVIGNTFRPEMAWFCPWLDMIGAGETTSCGLDREEHYNYLRFYGFRKPISWMDYSFVDPEVAAERKERGLQRCLFYAVHPGTGSFDDPVRYEPSRPFFRRYEPLVAWLDLAGWQPVTCARAVVEGAPAADTDGPGLLRVERYGPGAEPDAGVAFLTVWNTDAARAVRAKVVVESGALPAALADGRGLLAWGCLRETELSVARAGDGAWRLGGLALGPDQVEVIAVGTRPALARLWGREAAQWLGRLALEADWLARAGAGTVLRNGDFELGMTGWGDDPSNARDSVVTVDGDQALAGKQSLRAVSRSAKANQALHQGVTFAGDGEYRLRFRYRWERVAGATGTVTPRFGVKGPDGQWATDRYIYFRDVQPTTGEPAVCERVFSLPEGHSVGFFQFLLAGDWGTAWFDDVEVVAPSVEDQRERLQRLVAGARTAAATLTAGLAEPGPGLALLSGEEAAYTDLLALAQGVGDVHNRRCLLLPLGGFADSVGRATGVLTGVGLGPWTREVVAGTEAVVAELASPAGQALDAAVAWADGPAWPPAPARTGVGGRLPLVMAVPAAAGLGWADALAVARFAVDRQAVWMPRRVALRVLPPLTVEGGRALSAVGGGLPLTVRSRLTAPAAVTLSGTLHMGEAATAVGPLTLPVVAGASVCRLPVPEPVRARLEELALREPLVRLDWAAAGAGDVRLSGSAEFAVVRGTACPRLARAPTLDGTLTAGEWDAAATLAGFVGPRDAKAAPRPTTVRVGHDGERLFLAVVCGGQPTPTAVERSHDGPVWEDDAVEVFLDPAGAEAYAHLAVSATGSRYEARCGAGFDTAWDPAWEARTGRSAEGWLVEIAIPFPALAAKPEGVWGLNVGREEADTKAASCWAPTFGGFHTRARFGELAF